MKKNILLALAASLMLFSACQAQDLGQESEKAPQQEEELAQETEHREEETAWGEFEKFVASGADSAQLGNFIRQNIDRVSKKEAEAMIEALVIEHSQAIDEMNRVIYKPDYLDVLNKDLEGTLKPELIPSIENEKTRAEFQALVDGYLTIVRYEETPVVETDWEAICAHGGYFTEDFEEMACLMDKTQNFRYDRRNPDFKEIFADAVRSEELKNNNKVSFLTWQIGRLYESQVADLLVGPEGSYLGAFISKAGQPYESLVEAAGENPGTEIGKLIMELDQGGYTDYGRLSNRILVHSTLGPGFPAKAVIGGNGQSGMENVFFVAIEGKPEIEKRINDAINGTVVGLKDSLGIENGIKARSMITFANRNFLNMSISASGSDDAGKFSYAQKRKTFDMESGEEMDISDLFQMPWSDLKPELESLTGKSMEEMPDFYIGRIGIELEIASSESEYGDYAVITYDDVAKYIPMEKFYK